jgi:hypothetical protein
MLKLSDTDSRPVLLMQLLCFPDNPGPDEPKSYLLPVGQEFIGPGGSDVKPPEDPPTSEAPYVCTVLHEQILYYVVLVGPAQTK